MSEWNPNTGPLPQREPARLADTAPTLARGEFNLEKYARHTRNAAVTICVIVCIAFVSSLIVGVLAVVLLVKANDNLNNQDNSLNSAQFTCQSEGGSLPC
jgi:hypothetical protein